MAEPSSFRVNGIWAGGSVAGPITFTSNAATFGWSDIYGSRLASGQLGLNLDSTHGVVLDVNTDGRLQVLSRAGGAAEVRAATVSPTSVLSFVNAWEALGPATGVMRLTNWAGTTDVRLDFATDSQLHVQAGDGADTAILRANKHRMTNGSTWRDEADAQADLTNAAGTTGMRFDVGNVSGRLILRTIGGSATGASFQAGNVITAALTFATLPGTPVQGMRAFITDGSTATFGATVAGGGANAVPVVYDGTNWIVG